jgi:hypothetical protein
MQLLRMHVAVNILVYFMKQELKELLKLKGRKFGPPTVVTDILATIHHRRARYHSALQTVTDIIN